MGFPSKNTGESCHFLLQGIFWPRDRAHISYVSCTADRFCTAELPGKPTVTPDNVMREYSDTAPGFICCGDQVMPFNGIRKIRVHTGYPAPRHPSLSRGAACAERYMWEATTECTGGSSQTETSDPAQSPSVGMLAGSKCPGWWESLLLDRTLALDHSTTHRPCCPGWRFCSPLTLKGHSQVQGQTHRTGSLGLGCPLSSCLQRLKEDSLVPSALSTTLAATLTVNYKSLKYPFSFLDLETENMRENQLKWMLEDKRKCPTSTDVSENSFPILFIVCVWGAFWKD